MPLMANIERLAWYFGSARQNLSDIKILTGPPRSGTTWLLELLETFPGSRRIWEPFDPFGVPQGLVRQHANFGLGLRPYLEVGKNFAPITEFLDNLFNGRVYDSRLMTGRHKRSRLEQLQRLSGGNATFIKFCRAQRLLPWLNSQFDVRTVLVMRNPLAVVASQLNEGGFQHQYIGDEHPVICDRIKRRWPDLAKYAESLRHLDEKLTATWCFDYLVPLTDWKYCDKSILVTFEDLVGSPAEEVRRLEEHYSIKLPPAVFERLVRPSATTVQDSNVRTQKDPRDSWRHRLSKEQVRRILGVVEQFGLTFYSETPEPEREKLKNMIT